MGCGATCLHDCIEGTLELQAIVPYLAAPHKPHSASLRGRKAGRGTSKLKAAMSGGTHNCVVEEV